MVKAKRMMKADGNGVERQSYPVIHTSAARGLEKVIAGQPKVLFANGYIGAVIIIKADLGLENALAELPYATEEIDGIITTEMS